MPTLTKTQESRKAPKEKEAPVRSLNAEPVIEAILPQFDAMMKTYVVFNAFFLSIGIIEFVLLIVFFTFLAQSAILATSLALVFLTFFSYFILRLYLQAKQPEQYQEIKQRFISACRNLIHYQEGSAEHFVILSNALTLFSERLQDRQYQFYNLPAWLSSFSNLVNKFSAWCHDEDVFRMQESLLIAAIEENVKLVKSAPASQSAHASLANAYISLSALYLAKSKLENKNNSLISSENTSENYKKFKNAANRAMSELQIVLEFSPDDVSAHSQLASIYRDLKMSDEEMREYETILQLCPDDNDALCRLGKLYFQQGKNGFGLKIYDQLKKNQDRRADELIKFYGIIN